MSECDSQNYTMKDLANCFVHRGVTLKLIQMICDLQERVDELDPGSVSECMCAFREVAVPANAGEVVVDLTSNPLLFVPTHVFYTASWSNGMELGVNGDNAQQVPWTTMGGVTVSFRGQVPDGDTHVLKIGFFR